MKKLVYLAATALLTFFACTPEKQHKIERIVNHEDVVDDSAGAESSIPDGAVDLGIVMTREDGTTYKLYWAKSNLSYRGLCANQEDFGAYYAWGETLPKSNYTWETYKWCHVMRLTKYNTKSDLGTVDNKTVLDLNDDAAHVELGGKWRIPTDAEWAALREQCTWKYITRLGVDRAVDGCQITGTNGNAIFLPEACHWIQNCFDDEFPDGRYWSSSLDTDNPYFAHYSLNDAFYVDGGNTDRYKGYSIRPVTE